ncbi:MAG: hypothetical protein IT524_10775 [Nitrosomonas sp.]|nr:hypothetical protein [Nitrosomonas sp.]
MDLSTSICRESRQSLPSSESRALMRNLYVGMRLLALRPNAVDQVTVSIDQLMWLLGFYGLTVLTISYVLTPLPIFDWFGLGYLGVELLIALFMGFIVTKLTHDSNDLLKFLVLVYFILPFFYLISFILLPHLPEEFSMMGYFAYGIWVFMVYFWSVLQLLRAKLKAAAVATIWLIVAYPLTNWSLSFWYEGYDFSQEMATHSDDGSAEVNQEQVYYSQYALLNDALNNVRLGENGVADLFFIGFGSDGTENVFMNEVEHVQRAVNERLGATGRSLTLINNLKTIDTTPLASSNNLKISLNYLGKKMNVDEDIVFLYLTGHGSADHSLLVQMQPLSLNDLSPQDIKNYLDDAGIRWRIIVISACYSGGFIEALQNEHSLIFTAAAPHKSSFGCSNDNEYTYFGEALRNSLETQPFQYISSFIQAMQKVGEREQSEKLIPSEPQLFIGNQMKEKLKLLEQDMIRYAPERFGAM